MPYPSLKVPRLAWAVLAALLLAGIAFALRNDEPSLPYSRLASGSPSLTSGFFDWATCSGEHRVESHPGYWRRQQWGPATILGASGCGSCSGDGASFSGDPETAGLGLAMVPPHDFGSDAGQLPPDGHDHPYVLASTGEVVYVETDFTIKGVGFDFHWTRTYRSAYEYSGEMGYGWDYSGQLFLVENNAGDKVTAYLGNGRISEKYEWDSGSSSWTSPDGFNDQLTESTRSGSHADFPNGPFFTKTEKNGVYWEFDRVYDGVKDWYACTKIADPWGNEMLFRYDDTGDPTILTKITDTEGRDVSFTRTSGRITQVTVSSSSIHADYGNITIDYEYTSDRLTKVTKHKTRQEDGGTVVRPYTDYTYHTSGNRENNLDLVKGSGTTIFNFDYDDDPEDRCTQVTDADGEVHEYLHDQGDVNDDWCEYTDPSDQQIDFVYTDLAGDDRTIKERRDHLEDENGSDLSGTYDTKFTRDCDCGQITEIEYSDGSEEKYEFDSYGNLTKYTRTSSDTNDDDLVKKWTYDTFANYSRMLTTSGWLRAETNPSAKVTYTWDGNGLLDDVTWPAVTSGQPSSQTIKWEYSFNSTDGSLDSITKPNGDESEWSYSTNGTTGVLTLTRTDDPDTGGLQREWESQFDLMGNLTSSEDPTGATWTNTVTPDGRVLKVEGPNQQETKFEYDLRGRRTEEDKLLIDDTTDTRVVTTYTVSAGSRITKVKADDGGINATTDITHDEVGNSRYDQVVGPDEYGTKSVWGYGSHGLSWKVYNVDDSGVSPVETLVEKLERDTMGRVTARETQGGTRIEYEYDGYGRLTTTIKELPNSNERKTIRTLKDWGAVEKEEIKVGATLYAETTYYYDEAVRLYKTLREDPENTLADRELELERDQNGRVAKRKDERDKTWETQWDDAGRLKKKIDPIGNEVQYGYDDVNRKTTITYHEKDTSDSTFTDYDVVQTLDASGRVTSVKEEGSSSGNRTTSFEYDEGGRRTKLTTPEGGDTVWEYDNLGRNTKETRDIDVSTTAVTSYTYTAGGQRIELTDANNIDTDWTHDSFGRELTVKYNNDSNQVYARTYDSYGRLETVTDPIGIEVECTYDVSGRIVQVDLDKGTSGLGGPDRVTYEYDDMGRLTAAKTQDYNGSTYDDQTTVTRTYDGYGQLESETQYGGYLVEYAYDETGKISEITYPSGGPVVGVKYTYDDAGRVDKVERKLSTTVEGITTSQWEDAALFEYEGQREIEREQGPYDLLRTQTWTSFREPKVLKYEKDSTSALRTGLECFWDKNRRTVVRTRTHDEDTYEWGEVYRYDDMDRLTKTWRNVQDPSGFTSSDPTDASDTFDDRVTYTLGKVYERDNVKIKPDGGTETTTEYTNNNLYQYTNIDGQTLTWDSNGQLTDEGPWAYDWTALGQIEIADPDSGTDREYLYDALGRKVRVKVGSQENEFLYTAWRMIGEYDQSADEWLWQEIPQGHDEGMLEHIALDDNDIDEDLNTTEYRQYGIQADFQNTIHALSDVDGEIVERYRYRDSFGDSYTEDAGGSDIGNYASEVHCLKRLHGGAVEAETELLDFRNRWLVADYGSWMRRDPLQTIDSSNPYQAFLGQPLTITDQDGLACEHFFLATVWCRALSPTKDELLKGFRTVGNILGVKTIDPYKVRHCALECVEYEQCTGQCYPIIFGISWCERLGTEKLDSFIVSIAKGGEGLVPQPVGVKDDADDLQAIQECRELKRPRCRAYPLTSNGLLRGLGIHKMCEDLQNLPGKKGPPWEHSLYLPQGPNSNTYIKDIIAGHADPINPEVYGW